MTIHIRGRGALLQMLTARRPAGSKTETEWTDRWLKPLPGIVQDGYGNLIVRIGDAPVMWSSHTDTVHQKGGTQKLAMTEDGRVFTLDKKSSCLGADCTTGVWLMRELILAGKPGLYIFHRAEEIGGLGSRWITRETPELVEGITQAIAFDRRGYNSVVTCQGGRTCSDRYAKALAIGLGGDYVPDETGIFTDTANYDALIPECTNLSVGYHNAHRQDEWQDVPFAEGLLGRVLALDTASLPITRDPSAVKTYDHWPDPSHDMSTLEGYIYHNWDVVAAFLRRHNVSVDELEAFNVEPSVGRALGIGAF